jgi:HEAT repeats
LVNAVLVQVEFQVSEYPTNQESLPKSGRESGPVFQYRIVRFLNLAFAILILGTTPVVADFAPTLSTNDLVSSADLIIVGMVEGVQQTGSGDVTYNGVNYPRRDYTADINVDEIIKGESVPHRFILTFSAPSTDAWGNVAQGGLLPNTYRVIFLSKTDRGYKFVSPYSPSLPASPLPCGPDWQVQLGEDAYHRVMQKLLELLCTDSTPEEKQSALFDLNWTEDSSAAPFLKAALSFPNVKSNPTLRMAIVSGLLHWKDLSVLSLAEEDLFDQSVQSSSYPKSNLVLAISSLEPPISVPLLARVLKLPQPEERVAAARFLEYTNSQTALDILLSALDDPDRQVQFAVMQSLSILTNQHWWRPRTLDPDSHWDVCIEHWREFGAQRKRGTQ